MNKKGNRLAFSLIELSVVILVIGILVIGITQSSRILSSSRVSSAISLTNSSPVNSVPNLKLWLETSDSSNIAIGAFNAGTYGNASDQNFVANWKDRNSQSSTKIITSAAADTNRPQYLKDGIGDLPTLKFDGNNDYLFSTTSTPLSTGVDNFTYIAVWQANLNASSGVIFEQNNNGALVQGQRAGLITVTGLVYGFNGENNDAHNIASFTIGKPNVSVLTVNDSGTVRVYTNSKTTFTSGTISASIENLSSNIFCIGAKCLSSKNEFLNGYISEIIVFDRVLKASEISDIADYLGRKYGIRLS